MPPWLIFVILLVLVAISSKDKGILQAKQNAADGYRNSTGAQQALKERLDQCGDRCKDIKNDYKKPIANE